MQCIYINIILHSAEPDNICIVTEYCVGGTLFDLLYKKKDLILKWELRLKILLEIAIGMNFLHSNVPPIIHRDLKSLNILLTEKMEKPTDCTNIKISDCGLVFYFNNIVGCTVTIQTDGTIVIHGNSDTSGTDKRITLVPVLIFVKDFGDTTN